MGKYIQIILSFFILSNMSSCDFVNETSQNNTSNDIGFTNRLQTTYSPDKRCFFTVTEYGVDSSDAVTQVLVNFKRTGSGAYAVSGLDKKLKVYWKDNSTIVIETFKSYNATQKWPQVQSFNDIVKIEYIEK